MFQRLYRGFAATGTLTFTLGWVAILYLASNPSPYAETVGRTGLETVLSYAPAVMLSAASQWLVAAFAYWRAQSAPSGGTAPSN